MNRSRNLIIVLLVLCAASLSSGPAEAKNQAKYNKAVDKLAFAVEEIDVVLRAAQEGALESAQKQYKQAGKYFLDAMKGLRKADPSAETREQTEIYEDRFHKLADDVEEIDAKTVEAVAALFHEAHKQYDPTAN